VSHEGAELIRCMAGGDRNAFAAFYDGFASLAHGIIRRVLHDAPEADEVLQEVFLELWRAAGQYDPARGTPAAWVVTRARSRAIDKLRSLRKRDEVAVGELDGIAAETPGGRTGDPGDEVPDRELVRGALARLVPAQRQVIELAYFGGMTQTEIATRLRQPLGTVKTRMRTGLQHLRELLGAPEGSRA
jgi:RNA polymerase sigma-70 factor, ECF subfamily